VRTEGGACRKRRASVLHRRGPATVEPSPAAAAPAVAVVQPEPARATPGEQPAASLFAAPWTRQPTFPSTDGNDGVPFHLP